MTGECITAYDALDEAQGERIGEPIADVRAVLDALEARIIATPADTPDVLAWKVRHLARAVANDWHEAEVRTIARSIQRDLAVTAAH